MSASAWWTGPVRSEPDFEQLLKILRREVPDRPVLFEFFHNGPLYTKLAAGADVAPDSVEETVIAFRNAGYDYATILPSDFTFPGGEHHHAQTISLNEGSVIRDRASFDAYTWPDPATAIHALMLDPLTAAVLTPSEIRAMTLEMFEAQKDLLPEYK